MATGHDGTPPAAAGGPVTPERIMQFGFGYAAPLMLEAAVNLKVFDALDGGPRALGQVAAATGASERGLRALLNGLVGIGLLAKDKDGQYSLTSESAAFLVSHKPDFRGGFFKHTSSQLLPKWLKMTEIVRTGRPAAAVNQEGEGSAFFVEFVEDLFPMNYAAARVLADALGVERATAPVRVLDLAAGSGVWSIALAERSPHVRVTAVDWPGVLPATRRTADRHGVGDRYQYVAGDLLAVDFGTGHHVATLGHILHSEGEERSRALLQKTFAALAPGGTAVVAEWLVEDDRTGPPAGLIFGVNMLVNTDQGDTFSFSEIHDWLAAAGFRDVRTLDVPAPSPLILATKPGA
jgi:SAM-dependent methyltransferase